jgi:DNA-binding IclR family transcriptional regulator
MSDLLVQHNEQHASDEPTKGETRQTPMVERAFQLLDLLAASEKGYTLSELARQLGIAKGSMHNLLKTLEHMKAVEQDEKQRYVLGPRIYDLAQAYIRRSGLRRHALPAMQRLAALSGETVFLGQIESNAVRILDFVEEAGDGISLRVTARRGMRVPLLAGAIGRAVLASWPVARRCAYLRAHPLPQFTHGSVIDQDTFLGSVEETARIGFGIDTNEEYLPGINAIATTIRGMENNPLAIIWIAGFSSRFVGDRLHQLGEALSSEAEGISKALHAYD